MSGYLHASGNQGRRPEKRDGTIRWPIGALDSSLESCVTQLFGTQLFFTSRAILEDVKISGGLFYYTLGAWETLFCLCFRGNAWRWACRVAAELTNSLSGAVGAAEAAGRPEARLRAAALGAGGRRR